MVGIAFVLPVAHDKLAQAVQHRAGRSQTKGRQHREPGQHAKHMAMRGQHRILDHMAHDLTAGQLAGVDLLPGGQHFAGAVFITIGQRIADLGKVKAELPKTERDVQHGHAPQHGDGPAHKPVEQTVNQQRKQGGCTYR